MQHLWKASKYQPGHSALLIRRISKRVQPRPQSFCGFLPPDILHTNQTPALTIIGGNAHFVHPAEHISQLSS